MVLVLTVFVFSFSLPEVLQASGGPLRKDGEECLVPLLDFSSGDANFFDLAL